MLAGAAGHAELVRSESVLQAFTSGLPPKACRSSCSSGEDDLGRGLQAQEQLRTKVLQSFTQAPPGRARTLFLYVFPVYVPNQGDVHEWRTKLSVLRADPDAHPGSARARTNYLPDRFGLARGNPAKVGLGWTSER